MGKQVQYPSTFTNQPVDGHDVYTIMVPDGTETPVLIFSKVLHEDENNIYHQPVAATVFPSIKSLENFQEKIGVIIEAEKQRLEK